MAIAKAGDISMEYYVEGSGPPLFMIMGMGGQASSWGEPLLEGLQRHFTTIRFSNRGTGGTDKPADGYTIRQMADDAAGLLDAIGIGKAHVFGISMGGMIAQEVVLNHPQKVQGLVLGCTNCGPAHSVSVAAQTLARFGQIMQLPVEERIQRYWEITVTPEFMQSRADFLTRIIELGMTTPTPMETFGRQFGAAQAFDTYDRLSQIKSPTLILHGDRDILVPVENAEILHTQIPGSRARIVQGTGHCFFWEEPEEVVEEVVKFLSGVPTPA
jgi:pimeloyl-ACP methyl ester carboxylesterase